ncbi:MAG: adenylosuccinate lyase, partial [Abditibacteriota bacterium]|nr:adenylosuccinate lyase [Abditibacteriota bacterium]
MVERYSLPAMKKIWSEESKFQSWLDVEIAVAEAWEHFGVAPAGTLEKIKRNASFTVERIEE